METPSLQKATNKGTFKAFDVPSNSLTVTVPQFDQDTGEKIQLDINYNVEYLTQRQTELEAEISELHKEKNDIIALLAKFQTNIDSIKADYIPEETEYIPEEIE